MAWAGIEEQGEEMTLMIHHLAALGLPALLQLLRHETVGVEVVVQGVEAHGTTGNGRGAGHALRVEVPHYGPAH
ncbi:hypothetical protein D3C81_1781960 [compost metagenome]